MPTDNHDKSENRSQVFREVKFVLVAGVIGGFASWVYGIVMKNPVPGGGWAVAIAMFLGAFASGIGVYVLTNTDTRAFARTLFFAALCGFAWKPVCDAGAAFVEQAVQQRQDATAQELGDQVAQLSTNLTDTPSPQLDVKLEEISGAAQAAVEALPQVRNPKIRREIEAKINVALQAVSQVAPQKPQTASRVLQNVGESAARNQAANVSVAAMSSLDRLSPTNQAFAVARTQMQTNVANTITRRYQLDRLIHR